MGTMSEDVKTMLRKTFAMIDSAGSGFIPTDACGGVLVDLGQSFDPEDLKKAVAETDTEDTKKLSFDMFCTVVGNFMEEEEDDAAMAEELKEAFRLYDREGNGYITTEVLREILKELDNKLSEDDLDNMIEEIDEDGSGTVDFDEFMGMMTG